MQRVELVQTMVSPENPQLHALAFFPGLDLEISDAPEHVAGDIGIHGPENTLGEELLNDQIRSKTTLDSPELELSVLERRICDNIEAVSSIHRPFGIEDAHERCFGGVQSIWHKIRVL